MSLSTDIAIADIINFLILVIMAIALILQARSMKKEISSDRKILNDTTDLANKLEKEILERKSLKDAAESNYLYNLNYANSIADFSVGIQVQQYFRLADHAEVFFYISNLLPYIILCIQNKKPCSQEIDLFNKITKSLLEREILLRIKTAKVMAESDKYHKTIKENESVSITQFKDIQLKAQARLQLSLEDIKKEYKPQIEEADSNFYKILEELKEHMVSLLKYLNQVQ